jgi:hypothetical protein
VIITVTGSVAQAAAAATGSPTADSQVCISDPSITGDEAQDWDFVQYADTMFITTPGDNELVITITRSGATTWAAANPTFTGTTFSGASDRPRACALYENRLFLLGTGNNPAKFWGSVPESFLNFTTGSNATDAVAYEIAGEFNNIEYAVETDNFIKVLTMGGAYKINGGSIDTAISPISINVRKLHRVGCARIKPLVIDNEVIFVEFGKRRLRTTEFNFNKERFEPQDLTKLAHHITATGIRDMAHLPGRSDFIYCPRQDGQMAVMTLDKTAGVVAWHRHTSGDGKFENVAVSKNSNGEDRLWTVVVREVNGETRRYIEIIEAQEDAPVFEDYYTGEANESADETNWRDALYQYQRERKHLDAHITYDGSNLNNPTLTLSALTGTAITVTSSSPFFSSDMVGREIWARPDINVLRPNEHRGRMKITAFTSTTEVTCEVTEDFLSTTLTGITADPFFGQVYGWYLSIGS